MFLIIIIAILVFIAYQLFQSNRIKKYDVSLKVAEIHEKRMLEFFPHLYSGLNENTKQDIRSFFEKCTVDDTEDNEVSGVVYLERYKKMNAVMEAEVDSEKKQKIRKIIDDVSKDIEHEEIRLNKAIEEGTATQWEVDFIIWTYLVSLNESFPIVGADLNGYLTHSGFEKLLSLKKD